MHIEKLKNFGTETEVQETNEAKESKQLLTGELPVDKEVKNRAKTAVKNDQLTDSL